MRIAGTPVMPGIAHGWVWAPSAPELPLHGDLSDFLTARKLFLQRADTLPAEFRATYQAIAQDPSWEHYIQQHLQHHPLGEAIWLTAQHLSRPLFQLEDPYLQARGEDVLQVAASLIRSMHSPDVPPEGSILLAQDVSLLELTEWRNQLSGMLLCDISPTAHVAIIARSFGIPTLILNQHCIEATTSLAVLNAFEGWVDLQPGSEIVQAFPPEQLSLEANRNPVFYLGRRKEVQANINRPEDALLAAELGADGVGLVRTEYLLSSKNHLPGLHEETETYERMARPLHGLPVTVRTADLGGDKPLLNLQPSSQQEVLGLRGVRLALRHPRLFKQHIRAILNGFKGVELRLMFPMVTTPDEFVQARTLVQEVAGREVPPLGIMLEVPAAAFHLPEFRAAGCSFISLGTNDLQQYFFAASRLGRETSHLLDPGSLAFQRFVRQTVQTALELDLGVSVCGEAASDPRLTRFWWDLGVDQLSVPPALVPWLKQRTQSLGGH